MRVLYVSPSGELGGSEQSLLDVFAALEGAGLKLGLLALAPGPLVEAARQLGVTTRVLELPRELASLGESGASLTAVTGGLSRLLRRVAAVGDFVGQFRGELRAFQPDLLHTNGVKAHWLATALAPPQLPLVFHVRDYLSERSVSRHLFKLARLRRCAIVTNSESVAADARSLVTEIPVRAIHNAIDTQRFSPGAADPAWLAALAGMPPPREGEIVFALVSTYARWKGQDLAMRAFAALRAGLPELACRLYVVGAPIYETRGSQFSRAELRRLAGQLGIEQGVGFVPFQEDTPKVYRSADVIVHASTRREAFGRTIVEAMACGRAVVVSRAGGALELFDEGETAVGFESGNSSALAKVLARLATEPDTRKRLGEAAREHAAKNFSRSRLGPALTDVYRRVLAVS